MPDRRSEYDPEELPLIEPDDDPDDEPEEGPAAATNLVAGPSHSDGVGDREFEYRTEVLSLDEVTDGKTLPDRLAAASSEGWHFVEVIDGGASRVLLFRKVKKTERERRSVGFAAPGRS